MSDTSSDGTNYENWSCSDCGTTQKEPVGELAGERFEKTINPSGRRDERVITTVRCPDCGSEDGWQSQSTRELSEALTQFGRSVEMDTNQGAEL